MSCVTEFKDGRWVVMNHCFDGGRCLECGLPTEDFEYLSRDVKVFCEVNLTTGKVTFSPETT